MHGTLVGILADTHDNRTRLQQAVALFNRRGVSLVVHAGDFISPFTALDFQRLACPMEMVFGNNDGDRPGLLTAFRDRGTLLPGPRVFTAMGKKWLLMHEHGCLEQVAQAADVDIVVYGHTHEVDIRAGRPVIINPGEACGWLRGRATVALLDCTAMQIQLLDLDAA